VSVDDGERRRAFVGPKLDESMKKFRPLVVSNLPIYLMHFSYSLGLTYPWNVSPAIGIFRGINLRSGLMFTHCGSFDGLIISGLTT